ncbi:hypothetical protein GMD50_13245 [Roseburia intestinalis]|uniref:Uncharacterized protein n=1 Tax=Roseburia intestinalis TaxID=166486 RepID=A0A3R6B742_9FIRM|nr:hypothetical protein [Roseburia intestinalis]RHC17545.1 hypothetical protein DW856_08705 [Roseburia intestinalis]RHM02537.1 hypothetical protein DWZ87_15080 [Roseburia intestinalis]RHN11510.1 hypothetical protein DWZ31_02650 [Roseburia intestinalis]
MPEYGNNFIFSLSIFISVSVASCSIQYIIFDLYQLYNSNKHSEMSPSLFSVKTGILYCFIIFLQSSFEKICLGCSSSNCFSYIFNLRNTFGIISSYLCIISDIIPIVSSYPRTISPSILLLLQNASTHP